MDSNSGRFPLDFISFYLDMSTEDILAENTLSPSGTEKNSRPTVQPGTAATLIKFGSLGIPGQAQDVQTSSPSTEESVSAYVERTLQELGYQQEVRFLPPTEVAEEVCRPEQEVSKTSESDALTKAPISSGVNDNIPLVQDDEISTTSRFRAKADFFQTDTSEVEDLYELTPLITDPL